MMTGIRIDLHFKRGNAKHQFGCQNGHIFSAFEKLRVSFMLSKLPPVTVICIIPKGLLGDIQISLSNVFKRRKSSATCVCFGSSLIWQLDSILTGVLRSFDARDVFQCLSDTHLRL